MYPPRLSSELQDTQISEAAVVRALHACFGDEVSNPQDIPLLKKIDRSVRGHPKVIGEKPLSQRIEYRLLTDTPRNANGNLTLGAMVETFETLRHDRKTSFSKDQPSLAGMRLIAAIAYHTGIDDDKRVALKKYITLLECDLNSGGKECDGRVSALGNSGIESLEAVNYWVHGWKMNKQAAQDNHALVADTPVIAQGARR